MLVARPQAGELAEHGGEVAIEQALRALLLDAGLTGEEKS